MTVMRHRSKYVFFYVLYIMTLKIIINDETLEQVSQFTFLGCSVSYQFSNDVEFKLEKILQLIGTIKRTIFKKVRMETILKIYNTLVLPTFLYWSELPLHKLVLFFGRILQFLIVGSVIMVSI